MVCDGRGMVCGWQRHGLRVARQMIFGDRSRPPRLRYRGAQDHNLRLEYQLAVEDLADCVGSDLAEQWIVGRVSGAS